MQLFKYPMDEQVCKLKLASCKYANMPNTLYDLRAISSPEKSFTRRNLLPVTYVKAFLLLFFCKLRAFFKNINRYY